MTSDEEKTEEGTRQVAKENKREIRSGTRGKTVSDYDTFGDRVEPGEIVAATDFTKPKRHRTRFDPRTCTTFRFGTSGRFESQVLLVPESALNIVVDDYLLSTDLGRHYGYRYDLKSTPSFRRLSFDALIQNRFEFSLDTTKLATRRRNVDRRE